MNTISNAKCPDCSLDLAERAFEGVLIHRCVGCSGAWMHAEELRLILETSDAGTAPLKVALTGCMPSAFRATEGACPECSVPLEPFQFMVSSGVQLEFCPADHGIWLESGSLERSIQAYAALDSKRGQIWPSLDRGISDGPIPVRIVLEAPELGNT